MQLALVSLRKNRRGNVVTKLPADAPLGVMERRMFALIEVPDEDKAVTFDLAKLPVEVLAAIDDPKRESPRLRRGQVEEKKEAQSDRT